MGRKKVSASLSAAASTVGVTVLWWKFLVLSWFAFLEVYGVDLDHHQLGWYCTKGKKAACFVKASLSVEHSWVMEHNYPVDLDFKLGKWQKKSICFNCWCDGNSWFFHDLLFRGLWSWFGSSSTWVVLFGSLLDHLSVIRSAGFV